jgi:hypothetical protein
MNKSEKTIRIYSGHSPWQVTASNGTIIPLPDRKYFNTPADVTVSIVNTTTATQCSSYYDVYIINHGYDEATKKAFIQLMKKQILKNLSPLAFLKLIGKGAALPVSVIADIFTAKPIAKEIKQTGSLANGVPVVYWIIG